MASDDPNPIDTFLLSLLKNDFKDAEYKNVHEVFDLILQRPWLLDAKSKNSNDAESFEAQKRLYEVLYSPNAIREAIDKHLEFFLTHAKPLEQLLQKSLSEKNTARYVFLLYLLQTVHSHVEASLKEEKDFNSITAGMKKQILNEWPSIGTKQDFLKEACLMWKKEKNFTVRVDAAALIVSMFANSVNRHSLRDIPELHSVDTMGYLLQMGGLLEVAKQAATMPILGMQAARWIKEYFAPYMDQNPNLMRDQALYKWVAAQLGTHEVSQARGNWKKIPSQPMVWKQGEGNEETIVDLGSLQILKLQGKAVRGFEMTLPQEILENPDYFTVFGKKNFSAMVSGGKNPGELVYTFKDESNKEYRILFRASSRAVVLEQRIHYNENNQDVAEWFQFSHPAMPVMEKEPSVEMKHLAGARWIASKVMPQVQKVENLPPKGFEKALMGASVWVNTMNKKQGVAFLGSGIRQPKKQFDLSFDEKGGLLSV